MNDRIAALESMVDALEAILLKAGEGFTTAKSLTEKYGDNVMKADAARILGVTRATVYAMLRDGRLEAMYGGSRVSVQSIERYMRSPRGRSGKIGVSQERKVKHGADTLEET